MELVLKAISGTLIAVILGVVASKYSKEHALMLTVSVCCMVAAIIMTYLRPVLDYFNDLQSLGNLDPEVLRILLKSTGIAVLSEITGLICTDAGNTTLAKTIQLLATAVILWLALPLVSKLLELIEDVLVSV